MVEIVVSLVLSIFTGVLGVSAYDLFKRFAMPRKTRQQAVEQTLEDRLADLGDLMKSSAMVLEEVQAEIQARVALAEKAKSDAQEAEQLADLNEAQRLALARLVRAELATEVDRAGQENFRQGFLTNFVFFTAGAIVSVVTTLLLQ